ncbi:MAG: VanW family protein [Tetrasphaera sp.]
MAASGVLVVGAYGAVALIAAGKTPSDATISGVQVGGLDRDDAVATLTEGLSSRAAAPLPIAFGDKSVDLDPRAAGLAVDYAGSIDGLTEVSFNPADLIAKLRGSVDREATLLVKAGALRPYLEKLTAPVESEPKDATIAFAKGELDVTTGVNGVEVDLGETEKAVIAGWLRAPRVQGVTRSIRPEVSDDEVAAVKEEVADKVLAGPITLEVDGTEFDVLERPIADAISFPVSEGRPQAAYDTKKLVAAVRAAGREAGALRAPKDARVTSSAGSFKVVPSQDGTDVDGSAAVAAIKEAIGREGRSAQLTSTAAAAEFTTAEAKATMPTGVISTFTTQFPYSPDRTHNITLAARALNGVYIAPGEQFSLNGTLGERTPEKRYRGAPVIYDGRLTKDYGGGISQVSTTLFNAVFFSGARIDEFLPHSFYISRYPMGREATVSWPNVPEVHQHDQWRHHHPHHGRLQLDHRDVLWQEDVGYRGDARSAGKHHPAQDDPR